MWAEGSSVWKRRSPTRMSPALQEMLSFGSKPRKVQRPHFSLPATDSSRKTWLETFFRTRSTSMGVQRSESSSQATGAAR